MTQKNQCYLCEQIIWEVQYVKVFSLCYLECFVDERKIKVFAYNSVKWNKEARMQKWLQSREMIRSIDYNAFFFLF